METSDSDPLQPILLPATASAARKRWEIVKQNDLVFLNKLVAGLEALTSLSHLVLEDCGVANKSLLQRLPKGILRLELIDCPQLVTRDLMSFLRRGGARLTHLVLLDNAGIKPRFLVCLGSDCPQLEELRVRFARSGTRKRFLEGSVLQRPGHWPTWPESMRSLELDNVCGPGSDTTENLFQSLVDSAPRLLQLRRIVIKTTLDLPWRARAVIRHEWQEKLQRAFLRRWTPPAFVTAQKSRTSSAPSHLSYAEPATRQSRRLAAAQPSQPLLATESTAQVEFVQGLCDVVSVTLDNQKPAERRFVMDDFVDSEREDSDKEWAEGMS